MLASLLLLLLAPAASELAPGARYDARIPTLKQVVGHEPGEAISSHEQIGAYLEALAKAAPERTRLWKYGLLIAEAARWAGKEKVGLLATRPELRDGRPDAEPAEKEKDDKKEAAQPFDYEKAIQPDRERPEENYGAFLRVDLDPEHWLSAGAGSEVAAMVSGPRIFTPLKLDKGRNVGIYAAKDRLVASGFVWPEARDPLARKAFLLHQPTGQGHDFGGAGSSPPQSSW